MSIDKPQLDALIELEEEQRKDKQSNLQYSEIITPAKRRLLRKLSVSQKRRLLIKVLIDLDVKRNDIAKIFNISRETLWRITEENCPKLNINVRNAEKKPQKIK